MIAATAVRTWELDRTPDLVDLVSAARDAGHEVLLIERPMPDAVSVAAIGRAFDIVAARGGVALEDADGRRCRLRAGRRRILAAARLWRRLRETLRSDGAVVRPHRPDRRRRICLPAGPRSRRARGQRLSGAAPSRAGAGGDAGSRAHLRDRGRRGRRGAARAGAQTGVRAPGADASRSPPCATRWRGRRRSTARRRGCGRARRTRSCSRAR